MKNLAIIGSNIAGLYNAIKYIDYDLNIDIYEKKSSIDIDSIDYFTYNFFNDNHTFFINLLKKFDITYNKINITFNEKMYNLIHFVIDKSRLLPTNILSNYTFIDLCKTYLNNLDYEYIQNELNNNNILNNIFVFDFINLFNFDLSKKVNYYYISNSNINLLINKMINILKKKPNINIFYNSQISNISFINNKFIIENKNTHYDYIICTLSKKNILKFKIWNKKTLKLLNYVTYVNLYDMKDFVNNFITYDIDTFENSIKTRNILLNDLHVIYPQTSNKNKKIALWSCNSYDNIYNSNSITKNKIKFLYNNKFYICSLNYSRNNIFINYLIENIDNTSFIKK